MPNEIISYLEMCHREGVSLQRGMNFRIRGDYSIILMSLRPNAPYQDRLEGDGTILIYEGHDAPRSISIPFPKNIDQPRFTPSGSLTENGKFYLAAQEYKQGLRDPEKVKVYEKIHSGIWSFNGLFHLIDSWNESDRTREVYKFKLALVSDLIIENGSVVSPTERRRLIPTSIKLKVWKRDSGKCVVCGAKDELHFDHIIPFSRGGTSLTADNIQLLCARHNLEKRDKIE